VTHAAPSILIELAHKRRDRPDWQSTSMRPEEYFDLEPGEAPSVGSVTRRNHAIDYLGVDASLVEATRIRITDSTSNASRTITETFWNEGRSRVIERRDTPGEYWELIFETPVSAQPSVWEILRLGRREGLLVPYYHGFVTDNPDGSQTELRVTPALSS
jgi:hypothetical protein